MFCVPTNLPDLFRAAVKIHATCIRHIALVGCSNFRHTMCPSVLAINILPTFERSTATQNTRICPQPLSSEHSKVRFERCISETNYPLRSYKIVLSVPYAKIPTYQKQKAPSPLHLSELQLPRLPRDPPCRNALRGLAHHAFIIHHARRALAHPQVHRAQLCTDRALA